MNYQNVAGALLLIAGVVVIMGIITAEATYPGYSTSGNDISDLGASRPPNSIIKQPAATIFAATLAVGGVLLIAGAYFIYRGVGTGRVVTVLSLLLALFGVSALGVAAFNGSTEGSLAIHTLFSLLAFTIGGIAAIVSYGVLRAPFRYLAVILGVIALAGLVISVIYGDANPIFGLIGPGGAERWIVYPSVMWLIGFGGYLMGHSQHDQGNAVRSSR
ncbi:MAG: DUF998 domain-containing protein [Euryarchaeota archaeon]|nr:DUF998 domain-containing protein [Euryarchaeota archaeon]